jgi:Ser-tRNA(Ala) deacylase AlaX
MKPNEGRLQTAEHILAKIIEDKVTGAKVGIAKFEEDFGLLEMITKDDLRKINQNELQDAVNKTIEKNLKVSKYVKMREEVEKEVNLSKVPASVKEIRIVDIEKFDKRPCKDPHVDNTSEIGNFVILKIERVGNDRYRFTFKVENVLI